MEKLYHLKDIQQDRHTDFLCIAASIYLGKRHIGALRTCPDTKAIEFDFALPTDRIVFENFISTWWGRGDRTVHYGLADTAVKHQHPDYQVTLAVKMKCWIKSVVSPVMNDAEAVAMAAA